MRRLEYRACPCDHLEEVFASPPGFVDRQLLTSLGHPSLLAKRSETSPTQAEPFTPCMLHGTRHDAAASKTRAEKTLETRCLANPCSGAPKFLGFLLVNWLSIGLEVLRRWRIEAHVQSHSIPTWLQLLGTESRPPNGPRSSRQISTHPYA